MTPRWVPRLTFALALAGVAVAAYLTYAHFTSPTVLACSDKGLINCTKVTTSEQSRFLGIPVALIGLGFWVAMAALCSPPMWRSTSLAPHRARLVLSIGSVLFVLWLIYAESAIIRAICLWCTVIHVLAFAEFVLVMLFGLDLPRAGEEP